MRRTRVGRIVHAGCFQCSGGDARWNGGNAQGVAARHHDATGHQTWADIGMSVVYGDDGDDAAPAKQGAAPAATPTEGHSAPEEGP